MKSIRKIMIAISLSLLLFLAACNLRRIVDLEIDIHQDRIEMFDGEDVPFDQFDLIGVFSDGSKERIGENYKGLYYKIRTKLSFNHLDPDDDERIDVLVFGIGNKDLAETNIVIKRKEVRDIQIISYGKTDYRYGDSFDLTGFQLFVSYEHGENQTIPLHKNMLSLDNLVLQPENLGFNEIDVFVNGFKMLYSIPIFVEKGEQTFRENQLNLLEFSLNTIRVNQVEGAEYAISKAYIEDAELVWQDSPAFDLAETEIDYKVYARLAETTYQSASPIVSKTFTYTPPTKKPNLLFTGTTWLIFEYDANFELIMLDDNDEAVPYEVEVQNNTYRVNNLLPNHSYRFGFIEVGATKLYPQNIYPTPITTKVINDLLRFDSEQSVIYSSETQDFIYNVLASYADLIEVDVTYFQDGLLVTPIEVGIYDVELRNNFSHEVMYGTFEINPKQIDVTVLDQEKTYSDIDPEFMVDLTDAFEIDLDLFEINYSRTFGENVGTYQINATVLNPNYQVTVTPGSFTINKRVIAVDLFDLSSVYGEIEETFIFELDQEAYRNELNLNITRETGLNVGSYEIDATTNNANFELIVDKGIYTITPRPHTVTIQNTTREYGQTDPNFEIDFNSPLDPENSFDVSFSREEGSNIGEYVITATVSHHNYDITVEDAILTITPLAITATLDSIEQVYGNNELELTYGLSLELYRSELALLVERTEGHTVGIYQITAQTTNDNFDLTIINADYVIIKREITASQGTTHFYNGLAQTINLSLSNTILGDDVYAYVNDSTKDVGSRLHSIILAGDDAFNYRLEEETIVTTITPLPIKATLHSQTKVYHDLDPELTYDLDNEDFRLDLNLVVNRASGEHVGTYLITALTNNSNFNLTVVDAEFEIIKLSITVTVLDETKVYGDLDPSFEIDFNEAFDAPNTFTQEFFRTVGEHAGDYEIGANVSHPNYDIEVIDGTLSITPRLIVITIDDQEIIYEDLNVELTYSLSEEAYRTELGLIVTRELGNNAGSYLISASTNNSNFEIDVLEATYVITPKELIVTIESKDKVYGNQDPIFTINLNDAKDQLELFDVDYSREIGEDVGSYAITADVTNPNYFITVMDGTLEITKRSLTINVSNQTKTYGDSDPLFDTEFINAVDPLDAFNLNVTRVLGENIGDYAITATASNPNYQITINNGTLSINKFVVEIDYTYSTNELIYGEVFDLVASAELPFDDVIILTNHEQTNVGSYQVGVSIISDTLVDVTSNYTITNTAPIYEITPKALIISADALSFEYGIESISTRSFEVDGLEFMDTKDQVVTGDLELTGYAGLVGDYLINQGTLEVNSNYTFEFISNTLTIYKKEITLDYNGSTTVIYGDAFNVEPVVALGDILLGHELRLTNTHQINVGSYEVVAKVFNASNIDVTSNYDINNDSFIYTIEKKLLTVSFASASRYVGQTNANILYTLLITGFAYGETDLVLGNRNNILIDTTATTDSLADTYPVWVTEGYTSSNYEFDYIEGELVISQISLIFEFDNVETIYNGEAQLIDISSINIIDPLTNETLDPLDYVDLITVIYHLDGVESDPLHVGLYTITVIFEGNDLYEEVIHGGNTLRITPKDHTIFVDNQVKVYGDTDPIWALNLNGAYDELDAFSVLFTREVGENIGTYAINATITNPDYNLTVVAGELEIIPKPVTISLHNQSSVYGDSEKSLTYTFSHPSFEDQLDLVIGREAGNNVGEYIITASSDNDNFILTVNEGLYEITKRNITVDIHNQEITYEDLNVELTYSLSEEAYRTELGLIVTRELGNNAGSYLISASTNNSNFEIDVLEATYVITPKELIVTIESKDKVYGNQDPIFTINLNDAKDQLELFDVDYSREIGEDVGSYAITADVTNPNYLITVIDGELIISSRLIAVTVEDTEKTYGDHDPVFTYILSEEAYRAELNLDIFRALGEDVGIYEVDATTLNANFTISVTTANLTINKRDLTITINDAEKTYGDADPEFFADIMNAASFDTLEIELERVLGEDVGTYLIQTAFTNNNYNITLNNGTLTITKRDLTITINNAFKVYGDTDPEFSAVIDNAASGDLIDFVISRTHGENVDVYTLTTTYVNSNYNIEIIDAELSIEKRQITIEVQDNSKVYGDNDPEFITNITNALETDTFDITFDREAGENAGAYDVSAIVSHDNYDITLIDGTLTIVKRDLLVEVDSKSKAYGELDPTFTSQLTGVQLSDTFTINYSRLPGEDVNTYTIAATLDDSNYNITILPGILTINPRTIIVTLINQQQIYDDLAADLGYVLDQEDYRAELSLIVKRELGSDVGVYEITAYTLNTNFNVEITNAEYEITPREILVTIDNKSSVYGDDFVELTYTLNEEEYQEELSIDLTKAIGSNVGTYGINASTSNSNFILSYTPGTYTITKKAITATIEPSSKVFGDYDPEFEAIFTGLVGEDTIDLNYSREAGEDVGTYIITATATTHQNYTITVNDSLLTIDEAILSIHGTTDTTIEGLPVVELDYMDNTIKNASFTGVVIRNQNGTDITSLVDITYPSGTNLLANGATTLLASISASSDNALDSVSSDVIYKYRSVTVGNNSNYLTIEDALLQASGTIYVRFKTSFAADTIAEFVYGTTEFSVPVGVTLLLPFDSTDHGTNLQPDTGSTANGPALIRNQAYSELFLKETTILHVYGTLTANAKLSGGTPHSGYVTGNTYSIINMPLGSKIYVDGGTLNSNGFIIGSGSIEAINGAKVYDRLFVMAFRGGSITSAIYRDAFPFDQFSVNNIEVELTINKGTQLYARVQIHVDTFQKSELLFIGNSGALLNLVSEDAKIVKKYDVTTGKSTFDLYGETKMSDVSINITVTADTTGKDFPIPGNLAINIKDGGMFVLDMRAKILPGATVHIEEGAEAFITNKGSLMIYDSNEYFPGASQTYYNSTAYNRFRVIPTAQGYNLASIGNFINDGKLTVEGKIAGIVKSSENNYGTNRGLIDIKTNAQASVTVKSFNHSTGSSILTQAYYDIITYSLKDMQGNVLNIRGLYQVHSDEEPWTTDVTFVDSLGNHTIVTQTALSNYILPMWFDNETMSIFTALVDGTNLDSYFAHQLVGVITYPTVYVRETVKHQVSFETNGGSTIEDVMIMTGTSFNPNIDYVPTKENNLFLGWYLDESLTTKYTNQAITTDTTLYAYWAEGEPVITIGASSTSPENNASVTITATVKSQGGINLEGVTVTFTKSLSDGLFTQSQVVTNASGVAQTSFSGPGANNYTITATEGLTNKSANVNVNVKAPASSGSPYLFSENIYGHLTFEHEPISLKLLKSIEGSSYGTLRLLEDQSGMYYIQVIEKGTSATVLDHVELYAVDYIDDGTVLDLFFDILGNPHTIREQLRPVSFTDHHGKDLLQEVLVKDSLFAAVDQSDPSVLTYFTAVFDRPIDADFAKLMLSVKDKGDSQHVLHALYESFNAPQNLWWLDQAFMGSELTREWISNVFKAMEVRVELWNGSNWVHQANVELGTYLMESFLIPLDLTGIIGNQIQVRFVSPTLAGYLFDDVSIDFTANLPMTIHTLQPEYAMKNGTTDVLSNVIARDNNYVELPTYDQGVRIGFEAIETPYGYERGFGVSMSGYIYNQHSQVTDPLQEQMEGMSFEEIKQVIIDSGRQELIDDIPLVEEFYYTIMYIGSQDYETLLDLLLGSILGSSEEE